MAAQFLPRFLLVTHTRFSTFNRLKFQSKMSPSNEEPTPAKRAKPLIIGTHSGTFHCDEALACFMLKQLPEYEDAEIFRSRDIDALRDKCNIIVDVGGVFDHEKKWYDHHQTSFKDTFNSLRPEFAKDFNIRLSSAGLIYCFYGERVIQSILKREKHIQLSAGDLKIAYEQIYKNFIKEIDAIDNGVPMFEDAEPRYNISTHLSARVNRLNPSWQESNEDIDKRFHMAITLTGKEFVENVMEVACSWIAARDHVRQALDEAKSIHPSGQILLLNIFCPWKSHLATLETEYNVKGVPKLVVFNDGSSWRVAGVPVSPNSYIGRKFLPAPWRGLRNEELCKAAGVDDLIFVHHTGFIGGAKTKEAALEMAKKSIVYAEE